MKKGVPLLKKANPIMINIIIGEKTISSTKAIKKSKKYLNLFLYIILF